MLEVDCENRQPPGTHDAVWWSISQLPFYIGGTECAYAARLTQCDHAARLVPFRSVSFKLPCDVIHEELNHKYRKKKTALFLCMLKLS